MGGKFRVLQAVFAVILLAFSLILFSSGVNLSRVSAAGFSYQCPDELSLKESLKEISEGDKGSVNGLGISVIDADESSVFSRIEAEILIDAEDFVLSNSTPSLEVEILSGEYTVELENITGTEVGLEIEGESDTIEIEPEAFKIGGVYVLLADSQGSYPGEGQAEIIIGFDKTILSNTDNPEELSTIDGREYVLEIVSASDSDATIRVKTCSSGSFVQTARDDESTEEDLNANETEAPSEEIEMNESENSANESTGIGDANMKISKGLTEDPAEELEETKKPASFLLGNPLVYSPIIIIIVVLIMYAVNKTLRKKEQEQSSVNGNSP